MGAPTTHQHRRARWLVPEVIQTSWMDCGPASLKCMLAGFGIHADYAALRDLCQIDVDGTSIDVLETIGTVLGLPLQQLVLPPDYLLEQGSRLLPAIAVTRLPNGNQHFAVLWRRWRGLVQEMDPMAGRRWLPVEVVRAKLHIHHHPISCAEWRVFAESEFFCGPLRARLHRLGVRPAGVSELVATAHSDPSWRGLATLDAAARMTVQVLAAGGLRRGALAERFLRSILADALAEPESPWAAIPGACWSVVEDGPDQLVMRGAVVLCPAQEPIAGADVGDTVMAPCEPMPPATLAQLSERQLPLRTRLLQMLRPGGWPAALTVSLALLLLGAGFFMEMFMMRAGLQLDRELPLVDQRMGAALGLLSLVVLLPVLEGISLGGIFRMGRHLEARFRIVLYEKIPRLGERYFRTRLASDLAERAHQLHLLRRIPGLTLALGESLFELAVALGGIYWVDPRSALIAGVIAVACVGGFHAFGRAPLLERDLRLRNHAGALSRYYLDALLGITPIRTHGAERAVQRGHDALLIEWVRAARGLRTVAVLSHAWQILLGIVLVVSVVHDFAMRSADHRRVLLLVFWVLVVVDAIKRIIALGIAYPSHHHAALRAFEPIAARETVPAPSALAPEVDARIRAKGGVELRMAGVTVALGGQAVLTDVDIRVGRGEHVAIVGCSGSGKSTLLGLLLGVADRTKGRIEVDGMELDALVGHQLRRTIAWVDPSVQLWNTSVLSNLIYGAEPDVAVAKLGTTIFRADLREVLEALPVGMQTVVGQSGAQVSGGEGQRIRIGRAMLREDARLVLLDEPFRGLDRARRSSMLERCRALWRGSTLLCVTHDVTEALAFSRVLVVEDGRIVEDGSPHELSLRSGSVLARLLRAEQHVRDEIWSDRRWRRIEVANATVDEQEPSP